MSKDENNSQKGEWDFSGLTFEQRKNPAGQEDLLVPYDFGTGLSERVVGYLVESGEVSACIRKGKRYLTLDEAHRVLGLKQNGLLSQEEIADIEARIEAENAARSGLVLRSVGDDKSPGELGDEAPDSILWELRRLTRSLDFTLAGMLRDRERTDEPIGIDRNDIDELSGVAAKVRTMVEELHGRQDQRC